MRIVTDGLHRSKQRDRVLALATIVFATAIALLAAEWILAWYDGRIAASSDIEPGLLRYHPKLGWTLTPYWRGRHHHHDFDVTYNINGEGFRGAFPLAAVPKSRERVAIVGDSFTFGLGVNDDETFCECVDTARS